MRPFSTIGRVRITALLDMFFAAANGLASRSSLLRDIPILGVYGGDTCWAIAVYALVRFIAPRSKIRVVVFVAIGLSLAVECSQLMDFNWLEDLRSNALAVLFIGEGFLWSDLAAYAVGIALAAILDRVMQTFCDPLAGSLFRCPVLVANTI